MNTITSPEEFVDTVIKLRQAQRNYFQNRTQENLILAKKWESIVDSFLHLTPENSIKQPTQTQLPLR